MELTTIPALIAQRAAAQSNQTVLRKKNRGLWQAVTWAELDRRRLAVASALRDVGVEKGQTVAILCDTTPDAVYIDLGILTAGAVSLALVPEDEADKVGERLRASKCRVLFAENEEQLDKALAIRESCPDLLRVVILDMKGLRDFQDAGCESLRTFLDRPAASGSIDVRPNDPAALVVGADGSLETVTHADLLARVARTKSRIGAHAGDERLCVLPMRDPLERIHGLYLSLEAGVVSNYLESLETARENLQELKPTLFAADTESWTRLHGRIVQVVQAATGLHKSLYNWAIGAGSGNAVADKLVLRAVRNELGMGRLRVAYVAGALPSSEIVSWAKALGISIQTIEA